MANQQCDRVELVQQNPSLHSDRSGHAHRATSWAVLWEELVEVTPLVSTKLDGLQSDHQSQQKSQAQMEERAWLAWWFWSQSRPESQGWIQQPYLAGAWPLRTPQGHATDACARSHSRTFQHDLHLQCQLISRFQHATHRMLQARALKAPCSYTRLVEEASHDDDEAKKGKATDDSCDPKYDCLFDRWCVREGMKQNWCGLIWINPGMQNFEKTKKKNKDLATSPDIRVVVETFFFFFFDFCVFFRSRAKGRSRESIRESSQD